MDANKSAELIRILDSSVDGAWAELYADEEGTAKVSLLLLVGEPKRRKLNKDLNAIKLRVGSVFSTSHVDFVLSSPEKLDKDEKAKKMHSSGKLLKAW